MLTGYSSGPDYFSIDASTGTILVKKDLRSDLNKLNMYYVSSCRNILKIILGFHHRISAEHNLTKMIQLFFTW